MIPLSTHSTLLVEASALGVTMIFVRQMLMWLALRGLRPVILHRLGLPEEFRIGQPMRFGIAYPLAIWSGRLGLAFLIAPMLHLVMVGLDGGWTPHVSTLLAIVAGIAAVLFALDRVIASWVRKAADLPADWRAKVS